MRSLWSGEVVSPGLPSFGVLAERRAMLQNFRRGNAFLSLAHRSVSSECPRNPEIGCALVSVTPLHSISCSPHFKVQFLHYFEPCSSPGSKESINHGTMVEFEELGLRFQQEPLFGTSHSPTCQRRRTKLRNKTSCCPGSTPLVVLAKSSIPTHP